MYDLRHAWIDTGRRLLLFCIFLIAPLPAKPQEAKSGTLGQPAKWAQTELQSTSFAWPVSCNAASGIYLRQLNGTQSWTYAPITQLLPNGSTRKIDLGAATNFGEPVLGVAFDPDGQGNVYAAIQIGLAIQWYIAKYDNAGRFIRKLTLPGRLLPYFVLPIGGDRIVVGGVVSRASGTETHTTSVVAIFDKDGNQLNSLSLPEDDANEVVTKEPTKQLYYSVENPTIESGRAVLADDGDIYILRASDRPTLQVVTADGASQRTVEFEPPAPDVMPSDLIISKHSIAVAYFMSKSSKICLTKGALVVYGRQSGNVIATYYAQLAPHRYVCAQNHQLVYFRSEKGQANYQIGRVGIPEPDSSPILQK
jgi:hypothetical protein